MEAADLACDMLVCAATHMHIGGELHAPSPAMLRTLSSARVAPGGAARSVRCCAASGLSCSPSSVVTCAHQHPFTPLYHTDSIITLFTLTWWAQAHPMAIPEQHAWPQIEDESLQNSMQAHLDPCQGLFASAHALGREAVLQHSQGGHSVACRQLQLQRAFPCHLPHAQQGMMTLCQFFMHPLLIADAAALWCCLPPVTVASALCKATTHEYCLEADGAEK